MSAKRASKVKTVWENTAGEIPECNTREVIGETDLGKAAIHALKQLMILSASDDLEPKLKCDVCKWLCEMYFGKQHGAAGTSDNRITLAFEGELEKWSE